MSDSQRLANKEEMADMEIIVELKTEFILVALLVRNVYIQINIEKK